MPIGQRNPLNEPGAAMVVPSSAGGFPGNPQLPNDTSTQPGGVRNWQALTPTDRDLTTLIGVALTGPLAELPAPAAGTVHIIERISIATGAGATQILVVVGDLVPANIVDGAENVTTYAIHSADAQPIVVPAGQTLSIAWVAPTTASLCRARIQYRTEAG